MFFASHEEEKKENPGYRFVQNRFHHHGIIKKSDRFANRRGSREGGVGLDFWTCPL